jgi:hypothetical protein
MTFPIKTSDGYDARPVVLVDPATGEPYIASAGGGGSNTTEATQLLVLAELQNLDNEVGALDVAAAAADGTGNYSVIAGIKRALLNWASLLARIPTLALSGRVRTEELGQLGAARQLPAGAANANTALTSTCRRISIHARGGNIRFAIGSTAQTASGTSHYIAQGERLDLCVPATPNIGVIRADATDCTLEVTELSEPV